MTIALRQQATPNGSGSSSATLVSNALSSAAQVGSIIEVWIACATGVSISSVIDSAGQNYTQACLQNDTTDTTLLAGYYFANNNSATPLTVTVTFSAATTFRAILVREISGGINQAPLVASAPARIVTPGAGANAISVALSSGSVTTGLISGVVGATVGSSAAVAGTGFTQAAGFSTNLAGSITETKRFTTAGANNLTFTDSSDGGTSTYLAAGMLWQESSSAPTVTLNANAISYTYTLENTNFLLSVDQLVALPLSYSYSVPSSYSDVTQSAGTISYSYGVEDAQPTAGIALTLAASAIVYSYTIESATPSSSPELRVRAVDSGWYNGVYYQPGDVFDLLSPTDFSDSTVNYGPNSETTQYGWMTEVPLTTPLFTALVAQPIPLFPVIDPVPPKRFVY